VKIASIPMPPTLSVPPLCPRAAGPGEITVVANLTITTEAEPRARTLRVYQKLGSFEPTTGRPPEISSRPRTRGRSEKFKIQSARAPSLTDVTVHRPLGITRNGEFRRATNARDIYNAPLRRGISRGTPQPPAIGSANGPDSDCENKVTEEQGKKGSQGRGRIG